MKKFLALFLALSLTMGITACGSEKEPQNVGQGKNASSSVAKETSTAQVEENINMEDVELEEGEQISGAWTYTLEDKYGWGEGTIILQRYLGSLETVTLPDELDGFEVATVGDHLFENNTTVKHIIWNHTYMLSGMSGCTALETVDINDDVNSVGYEAFKGCTSLKNFDFSRITNVLGDRAFSGCSSLPNYGEWTLPKSICIYDESFAGLKFEKIIVDEYFQYPYGRVSPFKGCDVKEIEVRDSAHIPTDFFSNCETVEKITIAEGIDGYSNTPFQNCKSLKEVVLPSTFTSSIGSTDFQDCDSLNEITIPENVPEVYPEFNDNENMHKMVILGMETKLHVSTGKYPDMVFHLADDYTIYVKRGSAAAKQLENKEVKVNFYENGDGTKDPIEYYFNWKYLD